VPPRPDGKAARVQRVTFTRPAADRIAKAVRAVEADAASSQGPTLGYRLDGGPAGKVFRICTFTGAWAIDSLKTVTFKYQTQTPNTVSVQNVMFPLPSLSTTTSAPTVCAIAKDGTAWYLVNVVHASHTALTDVTLTSSALEFSRRNVLSISATASTAGFSVTSCVTGQVSVQALSYYQ